MAIRNTELEELHRLQLKSLESRFVNEVREGLNCSPFEAQAVMEVVREVFFAQLDDNTTAHHGALQPGRIAVIVVDADEPGGKALVDCRQTTVLLTLHRGAQDDVLMVKEGFAAWRRDRIPDLCQQALSQGGLLTREDLAWHIFYVAPRTISRDLKALREASPDTLLPLRSNKHDIGPVLTHRVRIVELALEGKTFSQIRDIMRHSPEAIANYLNTFIRTAQLHRRDLQAGQIAFLLRRSPGLIDKYLVLLDACLTDDNRRYHLEELLLCDGRAWRSEDGEKKVSPSLNAQP
jgi:hypothetical protein